MVVLNDSYEFQMVVVYGGHQWWSLMVVHAYALHLACMHTHSV